MTDVQKLMFVAALLCSALYLSGVFDCRAAAFCAYIVAQSNAVGEFARAFNA